MELSEILYQLRTSRKLSQDNVAEAIGVDYTTYARYESGKSELKASQIQKLARFYGLPVEKLFNYGYSEPHQSIAQTAEAPENYAKKSKTTVSLTIELDGTTECEQKWIGMISAINRLVAQQENRRP